MEWYRLTMSKSAAAKAPAYLVERISDLNHACELLKTSPNEAGTVLSQVVSQLSKHHDDKFIAPIEEATKILRDSPSRASEVIQKVVEAMVAEKELQELEQEEKTSWKAKN